jgi:hypothetical protein
LLGFHEMDRDISRECVRKQMVENDKGMCHFIR